MKERLIHNFINICHDLSSLGLEIGPSGNLSFIDDNNLLITPTGADFGQISLENISICNLDLDIRIIPTPSSDFESHKNIYRKRSDVRVIFHTHSHYVTLASMIGLDIPVLNTMHADYFGNSIKCVPFSNHRKNGFGSSESFCEGEIFLIEKHGGLMFFSDINVEKIINAVRAFEEICRLYCEFKMLNTEINSIPEEDFSLIHKYYKNDYGNRLL